MLIFYLLLAYTLLKISEVILFYVVNQLPLHCFLIRINYEDSTDWLW